MNAANAQIEKMSQNLMQACEDLSATCSQSMDAAMQSAAAVSKGYEEFNRKIGTLVQESLSHATSASRTLMTAKTLREAMDTHAEFVKECFDIWTTGTGRLSEISTRTTQEALEPVTRHAGSAFGKMAQYQQQAQNRAA